MALKFYLMLFLLILNSAKFMPSNGATYYTMYFISFLQNSTDLSLPES